MTPAAAVNPLTVSDAGGLTMLNQTGEFLIFDSNLKLALQPMLALSWTPNSDGTVWTFKLRPGVTFHNGQPMTADDVVYTFQQLSDPKNASNALSTFTGVLTPAGRQEGRRDRRSSSTSRRRTATSPTSSPRTTTTRSSSPRAPTSASGRSTFVGTGAFKLGSYTQNVGAIVRAQPQLLGDEAVPVGDQLQVLLEPAADAARAPGQRRRRDRAVRPGRRGGHPQQPDLQDHQAQVGQPPRAVDAQRSGAVHRPARAPGGGVHDRPPGRGGGAPERRRDGGQRLSVRTAVPVHRHDRSRSAPRTSPRPSSCSPRRVTRTASAPRWTPRSTRRSRSWRR